jgi:hypothetical protein
LSADQSIVMRLNPETFMAEYLCLVAKPGATSWRWGGVRDEAHVFPSHGEASQASLGHKFAGGLGHGTAIVMGQEERDRRAQAAAARVERDLVHAHRQVSPEESYRETARRLGEQDV